MDPDDSVLSNETPPFEDEDKTAVTNVVPSVFSEEDTCPGPCPILIKMNQKCEPIGICKLQAKVSEGSIDATTTETVREVLDNVVAKATKAKMVRKMKKPKMKSSCMNWHGILPKFHISDDIFKKILFTENLLISTFEGNNARPTPVGALCLGIQPGRGGPLKRQNQKSKSDFLLTKFLVHLSSQLDFIGCNGGSRITAWVDRNLQTLFFYWLSNG